MNITTKRSFSLIVFLVLAFTAGHTATSSSAYGATTGFDYQLFQQFLNEYTMGNGQIGEFKLTLVDYDKIYRNKETTASLYRKLLIHFQSVSPSALVSREEKIAFWINAYNFGAIKMIVDHYPVDSIRSRKINFLKNPWDIKILDVGGTTYALGQIEHNILLGELSEPLIHFGVVCASLSCPTLSTQVYRPESVMNQLAGQAKEFLLDSQKGLVINRSTNEVTFSKIFKFDTRAFPDGAKSAINIFADHFDRADLKYLQTGKYKIRYFDYDWSINAMKR